MRAIGLLTRNPRVYFEMLEALRGENLKVVSLDFGEPVPADVGAIITTEDEKGDIPFDRIVTDSDPNIAITRAKMMMSSDRRVKELTIGIDPGVRPGVAVLGDGVVLIRSLAESPEAVGEVVEEIVQEYPEANVVVRIGHGDRTNRNRIFNKLWDEGHMLEIVDERNTTKRSQTPDEDAAVEIAMTPGYKPGRRQETDPCPGEIRNIQRISRLESSGSLTVSKELARKVATGELSLRDAIERQENGSTGSD
jgi:hypothetical protein